VTVAPLVVPTAAAALAGATLTASARAAPTAAADRVIVAATSGSCPLPTDFTTNFSNINASLTQETAWGERNKQQNENKQSGREQTY